MTRGRAFRRAFALFLVVVTAILSVRSKTSALLVERAPAGHGDPSNDSPPLISSTSSSPTSLSDDPDQVDLPTVTSSGYVSNGPGRGGGGKLFWAYYEKEEAQEEDAASADDTTSDSDNKTPIFLWLEGGPGCASTFGAMYINGPDRVLAARDPLTRERTATGKLRRNAHAWNKAGGLLFVDQPVGTGFSVPGSGDDNGSEVDGGVGRGIPEDELGVASDLYWGLFELFGDGGPLAPLASRPLFIAGESYAGKFVPSIAHYILQAEREAEERAEEESGGKAKKTPSSSLGKLRVRRDLRSRRRGKDSPEIPPPPFRLVGIAVGNGLVDPGSQVLTHASSLYYRGLIDATERARTMAAALAVSALVRASAWQRAHSARAALLERLSEVSGVGTLLDAQRYEDYDASKAVDQYFNIPAVRSALKVNESLYEVEDLKSRRRYSACSDAVARAMDADVMKSTSHLFRDVLDSGIRVLIYAGADDVQDGAAATDAWLSRLRWERSKDFFSGSARKRWELEVDGVVDDERFGSGSACSSAEGGSSSEGFNPGSSSLERRKKGNAIGIGRLVEPKRFSSSSPLSSSSSSPSSSRSPAPVVVGYWRSGGGLDHVTVRNGGHMLPHDQPAVALAMLSRWSEDVLDDDEGRRWRSDDDVDDSFSSSSSSSAAAVV